MSNARDPLGLPAAFVGASAVAYGGQQLAGHGHVVFAVAVAALTWLALRSRPHRWVLLLVLLHVAVWLIGTAPASAAHWAGAVVTATGLFALHALTGWLPWAPHSAAAGPKVRSELAAILGIVAGLAGAVAVLATSGIQVRESGGVAVGLSLFLVAICTVAPRLREYAQGRR